MKKAKAVPGHEKGNKQSPKSYRPISLLSIYSKNFKRRIYREIFSFFSENDLISSNQSEYKPGDSCGN